MFILGEGLNQQRPSAELQCIGLSD